VSWQYRDRRITTFIVFGGKRPTLNEVGFKGVFAHGTAGIFFEEKK